MIGSTYQVDLVVNRGTKQLASCTYRVDEGTAISCGNPVSRSSRSSAYLLDLRDQEAGARTLAVTARLTDGGRVTASTTFRIAAPRAFARAWSNLDGIEGYQADGDDVLIADVVDSNGSGTIDKGDTVRTYAYPLDLDASSFAASQRQTHVITDILDADATLLSVQSLVPGTEDIDQLEFQADLDVDQYYENAAHGAAVLLADAPSTDLSNCGQVLVEPRTPGLPDVTTTVYSTRSCADLTPFDFPFVDVEINLSSAP